MITLQEARKRIDEKVGSLPPAAVSITEAVGCVIAEDITAPINVPDFASSSMDGIAVRIADLKGDGPWRIPIQAVIAAGDVARPSLADGHVCKIMTGAPLPEGADTVIKIEEITVESGQAAVEKRPAAGQFVRPRGNDILAGQTLFHKGERLRPADTGILVSVGLAAAIVIPRPRIALISTGPEVVEPGEKLKYGQIYDSNMATLYSLLMYDRFPVATRKRISTNDREELHDVFRQCLEENDLVISTGGVSMGDYDFIPDITKSLGGRILFHKLAVKPGKPTLIAGFDGKWLISLPGNPVSTVVGYHLHVKRILARMCAIHYTAHTTEAILGSDLTVSGKRFLITGARVEHTADGLIAYPSVRQESGRLSSIGGINGLIMVEGGKRTITKGSRVQVELTDS